MKTSDNDLSIKEKIAYGCGDLSSNLLWGLTSTYLMYYYTDIYRLPVASVAWILLIARVFDAFCDPLIGIFMDRKGGLIVPRLLTYLSIPFGVAGFLCFLPLPLPGNGKVIWAGATYILFGAVYSCINTPYGAMATMISQTSKGRIDLNSFRMIGCQVGKFCVAFLTIPAVEWLGGEETLSQRQFGFVAFVFLLCCAGSILWFVVVKTCILRFPPQAATYSFRYILKSLIKNRNWHLCNALVFVQFICLSAFSGFIFYYAKCNLGRSESVASLTLTIGVLSGLLGAMLCPFFTKRLGLFRTGLALSVLQGIAYILIFLSKSSLVEFAGSLIVLTFAQGVLSPLYYVLLAKAVDYSHADDHVDLAGISYALNTLVTKIAGGITGFILSLFLSFGHYDANQSSPTGDIALWVLAGFVWLPLACVAIQFILFLLYSSTDDGPRIKSAAGSSDIRAYK